MQVVHKSLSRHVAQELVGQLAELSIEVAYCFDAGTCTQLDFLTFEDFERAAMHVATTFSVAEYGMKEIPNIEDFQKHGDSQVVFMLEVWFNEQTMDPVEEMLHMAQNGKENVILGAFVSADGTYPIFITRVVEISKSIATGEGSKYRLSCLGVKWGYEPALNWPGHLDRGEAYIERGTERWLNQMGKQLKSLHELNTHRWRPSGQSLAVPQAWHDKYTFVCFDDMPKPETDLERTKRMIRASVRPFNR